MVPYVDDVTVMCVLLFVLHVCLLREGDGARLTANWCGGWVRCCECMTCGWCVGCEMCVWMRGLGLGF